MSTTNVIRHFNFEYPIQMIAHWKLCKGNQNGTELFSLYHINAENMCIRWRRRRQQRQPKCIYAMGKLIAHWTCIQLTGTLRYIQLQNVVQSLCIYMCVCMCVCVFVECVKWFLPLSLSQSNDFPYGLYRSID